MTETTAFAILAPVPLAHLVDAVDVVERTGFVAYGSLKWELFRQIDEMRVDARVPVLIYPSHDDLRGLDAYTVSWFGWYIGHVEGCNGGHPAGMRHRPESTAASPDDNRGHWAVFWHVEGLRKLSDALLLPIRRIKTHKAGTWRKDHPPRGPELVEMPYTLEELVD